HADSADPAMGAAARLWHQPGYPDGLGRGAPGGNRLPLSGAASAGTRGLDPIRVETFRQQPAGEGIPPHSHREEATGLRAFAVGNADPGHCWSHEDGRQLGENHATAMVEEA